MTGQECAADGCARPSQTFICEHHQRKVRDTLADIPGMLTDLDVTIARQSKTGGAAGGKATQADHEPMPYSLPAAEAADTICVTLSDWATRIYSVRKDDDGFNRPPGGAAALCGWLAGQVGFVAKWTDDDAGSFVDGVTFLRRVYTQAVDRRADRVFAGPCRADTLTMRLADNVLIPVEGECDLDLYTEPGKVTVACDGWRQQVAGCGHVHDMTDRRRWLLVQLVDALVTIPDLLAALPALIPGVAVRRATVNSWVRRGRVVPHGSSNGQATFRGGDLIALICDDQPRAGRRRATGSFSAGRCQ